MKLRPSKWGTGWLRYAGLGVDFAAAVAGFTLIGYLIDRHWEMYPKATLSGAILGLIGGMYNLVKGALGAFKPPPGSTEPRERESRRGDESR